MSSSATIAHVWCYNVREELRKLDYAFKKFPVVSIDTEFPGFLQCSPRHSGDFEQYSDLKANVNSMKIIQLGLTVSDVNGNIGGVRQFNFEFCSKRDVYAHDSLEFLKRHGIDFERLEQDGINSVDFSNLFGRILRKHQGLMWVTFHGLYDFAYTLKLVAKKPLPDSFEKFTRLIGSVFGCIVDLKHMARFCFGLPEDGLGLEKLSKVIGVNRVGGAHQAGSDSLLTAFVFAKMRTMYNMAQAFLYVGFLYGIHTKFYVSHQQADASLHRFQSKICLY